MDINSAELPASSTEGGGKGLPPNDVPVAITMASIARPRDNFDFFI
jgi:hypothetical protein